MFDQCIAMVNSRMITYREILEESTSPYTFAGTERADKRGVIPALNRLIDEALILEQAQFRNIQIENSLLMERVELNMQDFKQQHGSLEAFNEKLQKEGSDLGKFKRRLMEKEKNRLIVTRMIATRVQINNDDVKKFKQEQKSSNQPYEYYILRHLKLRLPKDPSDEIVDETKERMQAIYEQLEDDVPFVEMVRKYSEDPGTRKFDGFLGDFSSSDLDPVILEAVKDLTIGQFSDPVMFRGGYHIFYLTRKRSAREILFDQIYVVESEKLIAELREDASIRILDERFKNALD